jgi:AcrR family transcriptional regulator
MRQPVSSRDARVDRGSQTRARIIAATRSELARRESDLTLDHVAARLGITKQAVLYHFPSKDRLLLELMWLGMEEEADVMIAAVDAARSADDAVRRFLHANLAFHVADLPRFRLMYIRAQVVPGAKNPMTDDERATRIYAQTSRMYAAFEAKLRADPRFPVELDPRTLAVSLHLAAIGYATMAGELASINDTMKRPMDRYVDELATTIAMGFGVSGKRRR